ncbi:IS110 family transposase [Inquilinus sp. CAU 1745]|uniref:IS110 family transposase n=1 Tax=Inquilinus sp. CAU 1745 TaxID=3140369 RepID=UPI00325C027D
MTIVPCYVGCDIAKAHLDFFDPSDGAVRRVANRRDAVDGFLAGLAGRDVFIVHEATGDYDRALRHGLAAAGLPGVRINPMTARRFAEARGRRAKTDMLDARMLADLGATFQPAPDAPPCPEREALTALVRRRDQLVAMRQAEKVRLKELCDKEPRDAAIQASLDAVITCLSGQVADLDRRIQTRIAASQAAAEDNRLLRTAPGMGPVNAAACLTLLPELGTLPARKISALAGLAPFNRDSGARNGKRHIAGGRSRVRRALYVAAIAAIRNTPRYKAFYDAVYSRSLTKKVAIIAVARKLLTHLNAMLRDRKAWA